MKIKEDWKTIEYIISQFHKKLIITLHTLHQMKNNMENSKNLHCSNWKTLKIIMKNHNWRNKLKKFQTRKH
jgi:hypothetical protein